MPAGSGRLRTAWRSLWAPPEPDLVDAGQRGEWILASVRLLIVVALLYLPLASFLQTGGRSGLSILLWPTLGALAEALVVYTAVRRSWGQRWIGFFSGFVDISLVTVALMVHVRMGRLELAVSDPVLFPVYLLAIAATGLRYDYRITLITGAGALLQYGILVTWLEAHFDLAASHALSLHDQLGRLALLVATTVLTASLVMRTREHRRLSNRDRLTGLANRGFLEESLRNIEALADRSAEQVTVLMADVDHFKAFNDRWGHPAGDSALRTVARVLTETFRATDVVARYGGEEFVGVFPTLDRAKALQRIETLRDRIGSTPVPVDGHGTTAHLTVSIGLAFWPAEGNQLLDALAIADRRLYTAKHRGRNRVVADDSSPEPRD